MRKFIVTFLDKETKKPQDRPIMARDLTHLTEQISQVHREENLMAETFVEDQMFSYPAFEYDTGKPL